jgi:hypothetical protein
MTAPLTDKATGDLIEAGHPNDIKDYIEDGVYRLNAKAVCIQGVSSTEANAIITTAGYVAPVRIVSRGSGGLSFYASNGTTEIARLDESGNLFIKGRVLTL